MTWKPTSNAAQPKPSDPNIGRWFGVRLTARPPGLELVGNMTLMYCRVEKANRFEPEKTIRIFWRDAPGVGKRYTPDEARKYFKASARALSASDAAYVNDLFRTALSKAERSKTG